MIIRDNFCIFWLKTYVVTPHLNRLNKMVQMRGHNIWFHLEKRKNILLYHQILSLIFSSEGCITLEERILVLQISRGDRNKLGRQL